MRKIINLNFDWKYCPEWQDEMCRKSYSDSGFETVNIPHANKEIPYNYFDDKIYEFVSCYRKHFRLPNEAYEEGKRVLLHFEGAANYAVVYINGKLVGEHKGAYTPFVFDITDVISKSENVISVMLDSTERKEIPPFGNVVDYLVYGGIYREVWLEIVPELRIDNIFVRTPDVLGESKQLVCDVTMNRRTSGEVTLTVTDGEKIIGEKKCEITNGRILRAKWRIRGVKLWDINSPKLYTITAKFGDDSVSTRFGFRKAEFTKHGLMLNGRIVKLVGLNRHQSYPYVGYAMPASAQRADADLLKYKLGCNIVRTSHYPDSVHFIDRCDEIGLLVFTEMPSWQFLGEGEWRDNCLRNVYDMVMRDRNHPSVILWGVRVNEGGDCDEFYKLTNECARTLDDSRQTGGVRNFPRSHLLEDVYTYNDFSHSGKSLKLLPASVVAGLNVPYLVTENNGHMYPTKSFDREALRTEHALRHARVQNAMFGSDRISGAIGWCMADYNTHKDFGSGDRICYHGVTDMFRIPKLAAAVFASQQDDFPVMEFSSSMDIGDHPGGIIGKTYMFSNCDYIKVYKNGEYKSTIEKGSQEFKNLPHPPMMPKDYIGDALETDENLDSVTAGLLKNALIAANQYGYFMPPQHYLEVAAAFLHGKMSFKQIYNLVMKYYANWGDAQTSYKYEGYKDGKLVKTISCGAVESTALRVSADSASLVEDATYDVTRIELIAVDQSDNRLPYSNLCVNVKTNDVVSVIGPTSFSLIGGARAFWVKTKGISGTAEITIETEGQEPRTITLDVVKK